MFVITSTIVGLLLNIPLVFAATPNFNDTSNCQNNKFLPVPELTNDGTGLGGYNFFYCPTDGKIFGAGYKFLEDGTISQELSTELVSHEELECKQGKVSADYYYKTTGVVYILVGYSCKINGAKVYIYGTLFDTQLQKVDETQLAFYEYTETPYWKDTMNILVTYCNDDDTFKLVWNANDDRLSEDGSYQGSCQSSCKDHDLFEGIYSINDKYWNSEWLFMNPDYAGYQNLYPTLTSLDDALNTVTSSSEHQGYGLVCYSFLQSLGTSENEAHIICSSTKPGTIQSTVDVAETHYDINSDSTTLSNVGNFSTNGLNMAAATLFNDDYSQVFVMLPFETGDKIRIALMSVDTGDQSLNVETIKTVGDTVYNPAICRVPVTGEDKGKYVLVAWNQLGKILWDMFDAEFGSPVSTQTIFTYDNRKYIVTYLNVEIYGDDNENDAVIISWTLDYKDPSQGDSLIYYETFLLADYLTDEPTRSPTNKPTYKPTFSPSYNPTNEPSNKPSNYPTKQPSNMPSDSPSNYPTTMPTEKPSNDPSSNPTTMPTNMPISPTNSPTNKPTPLPTQGSGGGVTGSPTGTVQTTGAGTVATEEPKTTDGTGTGPQTATTTENGDDDTKTTEDESNEEAKTTEESESSEEIIETATPSVEPTAEGMDYTTSIANVATTEANNNVFEYVINVVAKLSFSSFTVDDFADTDNEYQEQLIEVINKRLYEKISLLNEISSKTHKIEITEIEKISRRRLTSVFAQNRRRMQTDESTNVKINIDVTVYLEELAKSFQNTLDSNDFWDGVQSSLADTWNDASVSVSASVASTKSSGGSKLLSFTGESWFLYVILGVAGFFIFNCLCCFIYVMKKRKKKATLENQKSLHSAPNSPDSNATFTSLRAKAGTVALAKRDSVSLDNGTNSVFLPETNAVEIGSNIHSNQINMTPQGPPGSQKAHNLPAQRGLSHAKLPPLPGSAVSKKLLSQISEKSVFDAEELYGTGAAGNGTIYDIEGDAAPVLPGHTAGGPPTAVKRIESIQLIDDGDDNITGGGGGVGNRSNDQLLQQHITQGGQQAVQLAVSLSYEDMVNMEQQKQTPNNLNQESISAGSVASAATHHSTGNNRNSRNGQGQQGGVVAPPIPRVPNHARLPGRRYSDDNGAGEEGGQVEGN